MLTIIALALFVFTIVVVVYRIYKYKFQKFNRENIGLIITSGILLHVSDIQRSSWYYYLLLGLVVIVLLIYIWGIIKSSGQKD